MFNFTDVIDRMGHDSIAADAAGAISGGSLGPVDAVVREGFDVIPMWVADMGFATAPSVLRAMRERLIRASDISSIRRSITIASPGGMSVATGSWG